MECQQRLLRPNPTTVPGRGGRQTGRKNGPVTPLSPVIVGLFKHWAQSHLHVARSLDIWRPCGIQTQNVELSWYHSAVLLSDCVQKKSPSRFGNVLGYMVTHTQTHTLLWHCAGLRTVPVPCRPNCRPSAWSCETWSDPSFPSICCVSSARLWEKWGCWLCNAQQDCVCMCVCSAWLMCHPSRVLSLNLCVHNPNPWPTSISYTKFMGGFTQHTYIYTHTYTQQLSHLKCDATLPLVLHYMSSDSTFLLMRLFF